ASVEDAGNTITVPVFSLKLLRESGVAWQTRVAHRYEDIVPLKRVRISCWTRSLLLFLAPILVRYFEHPAKRVLSFGTTQPINDVEIELFITKNLYRAVCETCEISKPTLDF